MITGMYVCMYACVVLSSTNHNAYVKEHNNDLINWSEKYSNPLYNMHTQTHQS